MWPFTRTVPAREHESCSRRIGTLEERVGNLELASAERNLQVLEVAEKVAERLKDRSRKRDKVNHDDESPGETLRRARAMYAVHAG
jgi:hypothetical protein